MASSRYNISISLQEKSGNQADSEVSAAELQSAEGVLSALQAAIKNYPLYPHNHAFSKKLITSTLENVVNHLSAYSSFKLTLAEEGFIYRQVKLSGSSAKADLLGSPLRRDGIEWIRFDRGLSLEELGEFLAIVNRYRNISDDADGDLVTSFWKKNFSHIRYHAADVLLETEHYLDFSQFMPSPASTQRNGHKTQGKSQDGDGEQVKQSVEQLRGEKSISPDLAKGSLALDSKEQEKLQRLIFIQESRDTTYDVIDILLILLEEQNREDDFDILLKYIQAELRDSLARAEFKHTSHLLSRLRRDAIDFNISGAHEKIDAFFTTIATDNSLDSLGKDSQSNWQGDDTAPHHLRNTLAHLPSTALVKLVENLPYVPAGPLQRSVQEAIVLLANQDPAPLASAVNGASTDSLTLLIACLRYIKGPESRKVLDQLCYHADTTIRLHSLRALLKRNDVDASSMLDILDDSCEDIRRVLLRYFGKQRNRLSEKAMLSYLQSRYARMREKKHIESCYRTLGACGSALSLEFLSQILTGKPLRGLVKGRDLTHRRGAALALHLLRLPESDHILAQARRSPFPHIRLAARSPVAATTRMS